MPRGNGMGPPAGRRRGQGKMGGLFAAGPGGNCICPSCDYKEPHIVGQPCNQKVCPNCGAEMTRE